MSATAVAHLFKPCHTNHVMSERVLLVPVPPKHQGHMVESNLTCITQPNKQRWRPVKYEIGDVIICSWVRRTHECGVIQSTRKGHHGMSSRACYRHRQKQQTRNTVSFQQSVLECWDLCTSYVLKPKLASWHNLTSEKGNKKPDWTNAQKLAFPYHEYAQQLRTLSRSSI